MRRSVLFAPLLLAAGCARLEEIPRWLLGAQTPRERYEARLEAAGLTSAVLGRDWLAAAERALHDAPLILPPHAEEGYFAPAEPGALGYRVEVRRGQRVELAVQLAADSATQVFLDAWETRPDSPRPFRHVVSADSGARALEVTPERDGAIILRVQPELLRGGRFTLTLRIAPTLAFPVEGHDEDDIRSGFGAPRDGGARAHHGIDIFAPRGTAALAATDATVRFVGTNNLGGNVVWLRDARGYSLYYAHLDSQAVLRGARVRAGDTVGFIGNTGNARATRPHLHFGIYRRGEGPVDPRWFVHRPGGTLPRLGADTALLGAWARTGRDSAPLLAAPRLRADVVRDLPARTALQVVAAIGGFFRVRLPDGTGGYIAFRQVEPADHAVQVTRADGGGSLWSRPSPGMAGHVVALVRPGDSLAVLARFEGYRLVRAPSGRAGWLAGD
jgi:murein DD-endopeptidase MepM/ murein hydrolase activator NlpD